MKEPKLPESQIEFNGKFYKESEFKEYKNSFKYKFDKFVNGLITILFIMSLSAVFLTFLYLNLKAILNE